MKRLLSFLLVFAFIIGLFSGCQQASRLPAEDKSALEVYFDFIENLNSAKITKYEYCFDSWYDILTTSRKSIAFSEDENNLKSVMVKEYYPAVFWDFPEPSYYNGKDYYYMYKSTWFMGSNERFKDKPQQELLGFSQSLVENYTLYADYVYSRPDGGYDLYIQTGDEEKGISNVITCKADSKFNIKSIHVKTYIPKDSRHTDYKVTNCYISYSSVNKDFKVNPPQSLVTNHVYKNPTEGQDAGKLKV